MFTSEVQETNFSNESVTFKIKKNSVMTCHTSQCTLLGETVILYSDLTSHNHYIMLYGTGIFMIFTCIFMLFF